MPRTFILWAFVVTFIGGALVGQRLLAQTPYDLPNDDTNCPASCRQIPWRAGSDLWNSGTLPVYTGVPCSGLTQGDGTTNNGPAIQACINAAAANTAVLIPAGIYYLNSNINMKAGVALRGAKPSGPPFLPTADATATTFKLGANGEFTFDPGGSLGANKEIASGYTKGSTSIVMAAGHGFVTGNWLMISEKPDTAIPVTATGDNGHCHWCGENENLLTDTDMHLMAQIVQATNVSENTVTLSRPLYYAFQSGLSPVARTIPLGVAKAGLENFRMNGAYVDHPHPFISITNGLYNWVKGVETYDAGSAAKNSHTELWWSYGAEIRDNYYHFGRQSDGDHNYGIAILFINSDHKIENNILRNHRHSIDFEGGGSGVAVLYNYIDDNYTDDLTYLGSARANHGAHPYMNLYEGNIFSHITADNYWGSSSHNVFFRNWLWGDETQAPDVPRKPTWGASPLDVWYNQNYYSFVGNVLGIAGKWLNPAWSGYTIRTTSCSNFGNSIYDYGCNSNRQYSSLTNTSSINHGNWDIKTNGVAYWEGGANHTLRTSMYYSTKPAFFGSCAWPAFGPDLSRITNTLPAQARFEGAASCAQGKPAPPTSPTVSVH